MTQWISSNHPQGSNREAVLLPNMKTGRQVISVNAIFKVYKDHKKYFESLLSTNIPEDDKEKIKHLLKKRWNPYVHRHFAITEKSNILNSDSKLRQYAGWTQRSNMHHRYVHLRGNEAKHDLLRAKGIIKDNKESVNVLQPKPYPSCREPNKPDAHSCFKCELIMSFEERERKDREVSELKEQVNNLANSVTFFQKELELYRQEFGGRHLTRQLDANDMERALGECYSIMSMFNLVFIIMGIVAAVLLFQTFAYDGHGGYPVAFSKSYSNNNNWTRVLRI